MQHDLCNKFFQYWEESRQGDALPSLDAFSGDVLASYGECGLIFKLQHGDIVLSYCGEQYAQVLNSDPVGKPLTDLFPLALKALQMSLLMPCFRQNIGMARLSRVCHGHRHKDVEWLMLPVLDEKTGEIALVGLSVTFTKFDERDSITIGSTLVERIMRQNFLSLDNPVDLSVIDSHSWAVLDTMGAQITVDGTLVSHTTNGLVGAAAVAVSKVAQANVLAVADPSEFGRVLSRLGARYNLKIVQTCEEARAILKADMIDVLVTTESIDGTSGSQLIQDMQQISAFTACVMMLNPKATAEDTRVVEQDGKFVQCLVKPVGEFALRKALDDANDHVVKRRFDNIQKY